MKSLFCCPVCSSLLFKEDRTYKCEAGHSFDAAKEGYVNLLISNKNGDLSGDDKEMVAARTRFLEGGYYEPLRDKMSELIQKYSPDAKALLDAGCGEGYYTSAYSKIVQECAGVDISKAAVRHASKKCKGAEFAVASVYRLPLGNDSVDVIVNCFSPNAPEEFARVLKEKGHLLYVVPAPKHLWQLKSILYDTPYENEEKTEEYDGFELVGVESVKNEFTLTSGDDIMALFHMTPYTWNTPKDGTERLKEKETLSVTADFRIHIYRKKAQS